MGEGQQGIQTQKENWGGLTCLQGHLGLLSTLEENLVKSMAKQTNKQNSTRTKQKKKSKENLLRAVLGGLGLWSILGNLISLGLL